MTTAPRRRRRPLSRHDLEVITQVARPVRPAAAGSARPAGAPALLSLLQGGGLAMALQPIVDAGTGRPVGYEALARFTRLDGGPQRPDLVLAEAASAGVGLDVERAALRAALALLARLSPERYLSVNLSPAAVADGEVLGQLRAAPLERIVLELTEHDAVADYQQLNETLGPLRARGMRLAIDDVGAGYSGLAHMLQLSPDILKLDMSLTRDVDQDPARRALITAMTSFTRQLDLSLIAEGVERAEQRQALLGCGVELMQGYLFSRPEIPPPLSRQGLPVVTAH